MRSYKEAVTGFAVLEWNTRVCPNGANENRLCTIMAKKLDERWVVSYKYKWSHIWTRLEISLEDALLKYKEDDSNL